MPTHAPSHLPSRSPHRRWWPARHAALALPWLLAVAAGADSIILRSAVRARSDDGAVLLRDVAELQGSEVSRFGDLVIATVPSGAPAREVTVEEIRRRLEQAGANWARIDLEGRRVVIRPRLSEAAGALGANAPISIAPKGTGRSDGAGDSGAASGRSGAADGPTGTAGDGRGIAADGTQRMEPRRIDPRRAGRRGSSDPVLASAVSDERSVRALVADAIGRALNEPSDSVRISFEGLDAATLAEVPNHLRIEIEPIGLLDGDRAEFAVRWWREGRVERRTNLSAFAEVARLATVASRDLRKGDQPGDGDVDGALVWVRPSERLRIVRPGAVGGRVLASSVRAGEPIFDSQFERQLLVRRGDRVVVRSVVGSLALSVDAIAQSDGREGEVIELVRVVSGQRQRSTISATVTGRGEAVLAQRQRAS
ncbi:MAG: flagellar basal body P-ring formation protein FlgA [Phycisphaeraceae bacterium]|nr:flagellar basal body P-ring formation protein FlgA [Phycisphaeraceae bacterium]